MHFFSAFFFLISTFFESISTEKTRNFIDFCIDLIFRRVIGCPTLLGANSLKVPEIPRGSNVHNSSQFGQSLQFLVFSTHYNNYSEIY